MSQKLLKQIRNEWRSNIWLCVELLVVSVVLWYIVDCCYVMYTVKQWPLGFNVEHCYKIDLGTVNEASPEFIKDLPEEHLWDDRTELIERLRKRPEIEAAAFSRNSHPYQGSNSGGEFTIDTLKTSGYTILRIIQPDFLRVFRIGGVNGETPEELADIMRERCAIPSQNLFALDFNIYDMRPYVGKDMYMLGDTINSIKVGAVANVMRYNDYMQGQMNRSVFVPMGPREHAWSNELVVRVRENMDHDFIENLTADAPKQLRVGNLFISRIRSFDDIRDNVLLNSERTNTQYMIGMAFLLVNIFLGLLGTFWFRTQQRVSDVAVRMVNGATRSDIFRLLVGEGLLLLTIVTPLAVIIDANIAHMELTNFLETSSFISFSRMLTCAGITYALMALMIIGGISLPASRAMRIAPAEALRSE